MEGGISLSKTKNVLMGVSSAILVTGLAGCGTDTSNLPPKPQSADCNDWEWDDDLGTWQCDDNNSTYYRSYFYGNSYYKTGSSLKQNASYGSYSKSSSFQGGKGFGTGSKSYGG